MTHFYAGAYPDADAAGDFSAANSFTEALGKYHAESLLDCYFRGIGLADIGQEAWMRRAAFGEVHAGLAQAERAIYREPDFAGVVVFLAVIFPPANWAQLH